MSNCISAVKSCFIVVLLFTEMQLAPAQGRDTLYSYQQLAEYVFVQLHDVLQRNIVLSVQDTGEKIQIENAFLREAQSCGFSVYLRTDRLFMVPDTAIELRITKSSGCRKEQTHDGRYHSCAIDIQWSNLFDGRAGVLSAVLIVQNEIPKETSDDQGRNWFEKVFIPIIVLGSSVLIVYLFFTVRS